MQLVNVGYSFDMCSRGTRLGHWRQDTGKWNWSAAATHAAGLRCPAISDEDDDDVPDVENKEDEQTEGEEV